MKILIDANFIQDVCPPIENISDDINGTMNYFAFRAFHGLSMEIPFGYGEVVTRFIPSVWNSKCSSFSDKGDVFICHVNGYNLTLNNKVNYKLMLK